MTTVAEAREALARVSNNSYPGTFAQRVEDLCRATIEDFLTANDGRVSGYIRAIVRAEMATPVEPATAGGAPSDEELLGIADEASLAIEAKLDEPYDDFSGRWNKAANRALYDAGFAAGERKESLRHRSKKMTRPAYEQLIAEDREWLAKNAPECLERRHIDLVLSQSVEQEYGPEEPSPPKDAPEPLPDVLRSGFTCGKGKMVAITDATLDKKSRKPLYRGQVQQADGWRSNPEAELPLDFIDWSSVPPQATGTAETGATGGGAEVGDLELREAYKAGTQAGGYLHPHQKGLRAVAALCAASLAPKLEAFERFVGWATERFSREPIGAVVIAQRVAELRRELNGEGGR